MSTNFFPFEARDIKRKAKGLEQILCLAPPTITERLDPCNPSPCGSNAVCNNRGGAGACQCIPDYFGDPYLACRPECTINADCPSEKACQQLKCVDPCPGLCGVNALCRVINHVPTCTCLEGYIGDPFTSCRQKPIGEFCAVPSYCESNYHRCIYSGLRIRTFLPDPEIFHRIRILPSST